MNLDVKDPEIRNSGLGGSDAGPVVNASPWKTGYALYLEKIGELPPDDVSDVEAVYWGTVHEDNVAREYMKRTGRKVRRNNRTLRHPDLPWMFAHIDREVVSEPRLLECKTANAFAASEWGKPGTADVPAYYLAQCLHYLAVTGKDVIDLAVLIGGNRFQIYTINRSDHQSQIDTLIKAEGEFWKCVEQRIPPAPSRLSDLALQFPTASEAEALAPPDVHERVERLAAYKAEVKSIERLIEDCEFQIKQCMGESSVLVDVQGKPLATWKNQARTDVDLKAMRIAQPELVAQFERSKELRVFRLAKQ